MPSVQANGIHIEYEELGEVDDPALVLIMGLSGQLIWWDDAFCEALVARGFRVIRFDNRDVGRSARFDGARRPDLAALMAGDAGTASYTLEDMADDTAGLLEALGVEAAHVVGASMGGMIAQVLAIRHPRLVRSLCSIMSTTGARDVGQPSRAALEVLLRPPAGTREEYVAASVEASRVIGSPGFPADEEAVGLRAARSWDRGYSPEGVARQLAAILASPDRTAALGHLLVPTLVIHGEEDPLVDPSGGRATARAVPGAELVMVPGMGHDLPVGAWDRIVEAIAANASRAAPSVGEGSR
ncbi:MAG TPA: alpha/beta fold hydrolase [Acidimicrobiales bacterium]|jgi:pimeloyl-ACP methyl ester carboxylesterase|nr:alpha/beta fold hydrolase [Acidimicrobiales bacterium]